MSYEYTYRFRIYPNKAQRQTLARTFGCARYVYNWGKEVRTDAYHGEGESLSYTGTAKREIPDLPKTKKTVGIDLGLTDVVVTSDGRESGNPRFLRQSEIGL